MGALFSAQPASSGKAAAAPKASDRPRNSRRLIFIMFLVFLVCELRQSILPASAGEPQHHFSSELGGAGSAAFLTAWRLRPCTATRARSKASFEPRPAASSLASTATGKAA